MSPDAALALYRDHCQPGDRGTLERYGEKAAVAAILAVANHIEDEARRYAGFYETGTDGRNTFVIFADAIDRLTAERLAPAPSSEIRR